MLAILPSTSYSYDAASHLTQIIQGGQVVTLQYDIASRRTRLTLPNQVSTEYQYDAVSRLAALIYRHAAGQLGDLTYQYDAAGNRTGVGGSFARTGLPTPIASATYDAANRQLSFGGQTLAYDPNGSLISDGTTTHTWDARNRLVGLTGPSNNASFRYDALGRRSRKSINGTQTDFAYDGRDPVQELSSATALATILTGLGIDEYLTRTDGAGQRGFLTDALGSTVALTDPTGTVATSYTYEPFGATTLSGATTTNSFEYTGRENDGTGLRYYRARYHSPALHRFVTEDPVGFRRDEINLYVYVTNNPLRFADPLGLEKCSATGSEHAFPPGLEWIGFYINIVEKPLARAAIASAAIGTGAVVATGGMIATGAAVAAVPATSGISLVLVPGGLITTAGGFYLIGLGTDMSVNEINGLLGTQLPGPNDVAPSLFPRLPPVFGKTCP